MSNLHSVILILGNIIQIDTAIFLKKIILSHVCERAVSKL